MKNNGSVMNLYAFWGGRTAAISGEALLLFVIPIYMAHSDTFSALQIASVPAIGFTAELISIGIVPHLQHLSEKLNILQLIDVARTITILLLVCSVSLPFNSAVYMLSFAGLSGALNGVHETMLISSIPKLTQNPLELHKINGTLQSLDNSSRTVATALSAFLFARIHLVGVLLLCVALFTVSALTYSRSGLKVNSTDFKTREGQVQRLYFWRKGLKLIKTREPLLLLTLISTSINFFASATLGIAVIYLTNDLDLPSTAYSLAGAFSTLGVILGSRTSIRLPNNPSQTLPSALSVYLLGSIIFSLPAVFGLIASTNIVSAIVITGQGIIGVGTGIYVSTNSTLQQSLLANDERVSAFTVMRFFKITAIPAGYLFGGQIAEAFSASASILSSTIGVALTVLAIFAARHRLPREQVHIPQN